MVVRLLGRTPLVLVFLFVRVVGCSRARRYNIDYKRLSLRTLRRKYLIEINKCSVGPSTLSRQTVHAMPCLFPRPLELACGLIGDVFELAGGMVDLNFDRVALDFVS